MRPFRMAWRKRQNDPSLAAPVPLDTLDDGQLLSLVLLDSTHHRAPEAVRLLKDGESLRQVATECPNPACREIAYERLGEPQRVFLTRWLADPDLTHEVIVCQGPSSVAKKRLEEAVSGLTDPAVLRELIVLTNDDALRAKAFEKLGALAPDDELQTIAAEIAERLLEEVLAGPFAHPSIDLLHGLRGSHRWVPGLERVLDDEACAPVLLDVLSFIRFKTDSPGWGRFVRKNAARISRVLTRTFAGATSPYELLRFVRDCEMLELAWHGCVNESHVDMLARHMVRYGMHRDYDGSPMASEGVLEDVYKHGFLQDSIRRYSGTLLYKGGSIESGVGDDTYRDIWQDRYFVV